MSEGWRNRKNYYTYRKTRAQLLQDNQVHNAGRCTLAVPGVCSGKATQIHHTHGVANGHDPAHMIPVCGPCNRYIGDPSVGRDPKGRPPAWI